MFSDPASERFAKAVEADPIGIVPFDAKLFGTATNNGQMIVEVDPANKTGEILAEVGRIVMEGLCSELMEKDDIKEFYLGQKQEGVRAGRRWKRKKLWR